MKNLGIILFFLVSLTYLVAAQSGQVEGLIAKAQAGDAKAQNELGVRYLLGDGIEKDPKQAVEWYRKAARSGYPEAMFNLGAAYFNGTGVKIDDSAAFAFFSAAAAGGSMQGKDAVVRAETDLTKRRLAEGYLLLGDMLSITNDLPHDYQAARRAYEMAGDSMPIALLRLASMELDGKGAPPDPEKAKAHCGRASEMNDPGGACCIGILYEGQKLGPPDYKTAREWYLKAAKQAYAPAAYYLGNMYAKGNGVAADQTVAFSWFYLAASGDARAKAAFDDLSQKLSISDQTKGVKLAQKWMAENHIYIPTLRTRCLECCNAPRRCVTFLFMSRPVPASAHAEIEEVVEFKHTLTAHHSQLPPVYSTPDMIRLMETACFHALLPYADEGEINVGTAIHVEHRAATGIGSRVRARAEFESFDGRFYIMRVSAWVVVDPAQQSGTKEIGRGTIHRAVIKIADFLSKLPNA